MLCFWDAVHYSSIPLFKREVKYTNCNIYHVDHFSIHLSAIWVSHNAMYEILATISSQNLSSPKAEQHFSCHTAPCSAFLDTWQQPLTSGPCGSLLPINGVIHCLFCGWLISLSPLPSWCIWCSTCQALPSTNTHLHTYGLECGSYHLTLLNNTSLNTGYECIFQARLQFFCTFRQSGKVE